MTKLCVTSESEGVAILSSDMMKCRHQLELENSRFRVNRRRYFFTLLLDLSGGFLCQQTFQMLKINMDIESALKEIHSEKETSSGVI